MRTIHVSSDLRRKRSAGKVKAREEGACRLCARPSAVRTLTRHHLIPQGWFVAQTRSVALLRDADANIVPLCRPCHDAVEERDGGSARSILRKLLSQAEIAFMIQVKGKAWLDERYPPGAAERVARGFEECDYQVA